MKLFFRKLGEGQPLIILHGVFGMGDNWMTLAKEFAANNFCVYVVDARNHGRSPHADEFSFEAMAADIFELMNDDAGLIGRAASFIGHSMGGKTAMLFSMLHPDRVKNLIVVDIVPRAYPSANQNVIAALKSIDLNTVSARKEVEEKLRTDLKGDEATVQFLLKSLYWKEGNAQKLAWRFNVNAIAKNINTGDALQKDDVFTGPTLFIRGEKSSFITDEDEPLIKKHFPNAEIVTIPNAGHWVHANKPKEFMDTVLAFQNKG